MITAGTDGFLEPHVAADLKRDQRAGCEGKHEGKILIASARERRPRVQPPDAAPLRGPAKERKRQKLSNRVAAARAYSKVRAIGCRLC